VLCLLSMFLLNLICNTAGAKQAYLFEIKRGSIEGWCLALWQLLGVLLVFKRKNKTESAILVVCVALVSLPVLLLILLDRGVGSSISSHAISLIAPALFGFLAAVISCAVVRATVGIALESKDDSVELRCNSIANVILILLMIATPFVAFALSEFPNEALRDFFINERYGVKQFVEDLFAPLILCSGVAVATLPVTIILLSPKIRWLPLLLTLAFGLVVTGVFVLIALEGNTDMGIAHHSVRATSMFVCWMIFILVCRSEYKLRVVATRSTRISRLLLGSKP